MRWLVMAVALAASAPAHAGMVCRSIGITGFEAQARLATTVLAAATADPQSLEVFVAHTPLGYYYQSNFVRAGGGYAVKIYSATPLDPRALVENLLYASRDEADANAALTDAVLARGPVRRGAPEADPPAAWPATVLAAVSVGEP